MIQHPDIYEIARVAPTIRECVKVMERLSKAVAQWDGSFQQTVKHGERVKSQT